jgi:hypothetical protein
MDRREIEGVEAPLGHNLDQASVAQQLGLHNRRKFAETRARQQGVRNAVVVINREVWFER